MKRITALILIIMLLGGIGVTVNASDRMVSTTNFAYTSFENCEQMAYISFDINANTLSDGFIGITSGNVIPDAYSDYAVCFRIRPDGTFDANNGSSTYARVEVVSYEKNKTYRVDVVADIINQVFDIYVTSNGTRHVIAESYAFRTYADNLGRITACAGRGIAAGLFYIENISFKAGEGVMEEFTLPNYYTEKMVLQRGEPHLVFGKAATNAEEITVTLSNGSSTSTTVVKPENGEFRAYLNPLEASLEPYTLTIRGKNKTQVINEVYIGDVFILAGQSNMEQNYTYQAREQMGAGVTVSNLPQMIADDRIKHFTLSRVTSNIETFNVPFSNGAWQNLTAANQKNLSYIGMFFAKERLEDEPDVPVGIISVAWGGTKIDRWIRNSEENKSLNYTTLNGNIYNNHIAPFIKYPIKAFLWYQGESDSRIPVGYAEAFRTMIRDWRNLWGKEDLPFLFVQLARYTWDNYAPQRQAQLSVLDEKNVGMVVAIDTDKSTQGNIHPLGKEILAQRFNLLAEKYVYGENVVAEGPIFESAKAENGKLIITFRKDTIGDGLMIKNPYGATTNELCEFEIAEENGSFVKAKAVINNDDTITLSAEGVANPAFARYAYSAVPENPNLYNKNGLPASPFTTDTRYLSANYFLTRAFENENSSVQIAEFKMCPLKDNIDGVVSITDINNAVTDWKNAGIVVTFNSNGFINYVDGAVFKTSKYQYTKGQVYEVKVIADFGKNTYSMLVNTDEGWEVMCENAAFRTGSLSMKNMGRLLVRGGYQAPAEELFVSGYKVESPEEHTIIKAKDATFVIRPSAMVVEATYSDNSLTDVALIKKNNGVNILKTDEGEYKKVFVWKENIEPLD